MKSMRNVVLVSALVVLPSLALAQVGAAGAVTGASRVMPPAPPAVPPTPPPPVLPPPTVQAGGAVNGAAAAATSVRPPVVSSPTAVTSSVNTQTAAGASSTGVTGNAAANAAGAGQTNGLNVAGNMNQNSSFAVNSAATINEIQTASFTTRRELASSIEGRLDATQQTLAALRTRADAAGDRSRQAFTRAASEVRERERALRARLRATAGTTNDLVWSSAQTALVNDYTAYAQAVASAEAAAQGSASTGVSTP